MEAALRLSEFIAQNIAKTAWAFATLWLEEGMDDAQATVDEGDWFVENVTAEALPESFRVKLADPTQYDVVASAFAGRPGIEQVNDQRQILDKFFKMSLEALQEKGDDGKEVTIVRVPLAGSTRERKDRGIVDRIDRENIWIRLSDQNAVMPFKISEVTDRFIFGQVSDKFGKGSAEYRIPMGLLALYRGVPDVATEHFNVRQSKGAMPESWLNLLKWYQENIGN